MLHVTGRNRNQHCIELMLPQTEFRNNRGAPNHQHGRWEQVPTRYSHLPVVSVIRNPVDRNISNYEFRWWATHPVAEPELIRQHFPDFPDLTFTEYLDYQNFNTQFRDTGVPVPADIGNQTVQFIQFFFKRPKEVFAKLNDEYIYEGKYRKDLPELTLLTTENLNRELYDYLSGMDFSTRELNFILDVDRIRPGDTERLDDQARMQYLSEDILTDIQIRERYLYAIYRDCGINYEQEMEVAE